MSAEQLFEYKNDFLFFAIRRDKGRGEDLLVYCSGVNVSLFSTVTQGRHGIGSNPAVRGLQLVNHGVRELVLSKGATPLAIRGKDCAGLAPTMDIWYTELLAIQGAPVSLADEIIRYGVIELVRKIFKASLRELKLPDNLPGPHDLQALLERECRK